jgi:hypothetical protein
MVRNTPPYGHASTYQISFTYLERQKCYGPDKKILFKKQLFDHEVKGQYKNLPGLTITFILSFNSYVSPSNEGRHIVLV